MRIIESTVSMASQHSFVRTQTTNDSINMWNNTENMDGHNGNNTRGNFILMDLVEISKEAEEAYKENIFETGKAGSSDDMLYGMPEEDKQNMHVLEEMLSALTGKKIKFIVPEDIKLTGNSKPVIRFINNISAADKGTTGRGIEIKHEEFFSESESLSFSSSGIIKTSDGKQISFNVNLNLSREFVQKSSLEVRMGDARKVDPLIINYDGPSANIKTTRFDFDLNSDGIDESIPVIAEGSGFLCMDMNNDGIINNGRELFGPSSGNGFEQLSQYDEDGNLWIDENDPIYDKLKIWVKDDNGNDKLFALGQKGIGAIYLGNIDSTFSMKNSSNSTIAENRDTGIFIREDGSAGTLQQVDFVV